MRRPYHILDVFTDEPLSGNPLAVVMKADDLSDTRMQAIAREFNLSETVFVLRPRDDANTARLRIFTPRVELPFAGHPTIGAAALLAQERAGDLLASTDVTLALEEPLGIVTCDVRGAEPMSTVRFALPQMPTSLESAPLSAAAADALGIEAEEIGFDDHRVSVWSAGIPFCFVPVRDARVVARAAPSASFAAAFGAGGGKAYVYTRETRDMNHDFFARMFGAGVGVAEDPATGAAIAAFAGVVAASEGLRDGTHSIVVEQGFDMGRPSLLTLVVDIAERQLAGASLRGSAVRVADGTLRV